MEVDSRMAIKLDKALHKIPSRFALATVTAKRWEQLIQGGRPMVESPSPRSMTVVFKEIETDKLALDMDEKTIHKLGTPIPLPEPPAPPPQELLPPIPEEEPEVEGTAA